LDTNGSNVPEQLLNNWVFGGLASRKFFGSILELRCSEGTNVMGY
jgi:hypothetical protein